MASVDRFNRRFSTSSLPRSAYDGSHLTWQAFRLNVLAPHRIRILDSPPHDRLPQELLDAIEKGTKNAARFEKQKSDFKAQVISGRAFGPSPLFPPNLLPPIDKILKLARCMIPRYNREALPERAPNQQGALYELSVPRSGLGCGFGVDAFESEELDVLPSWLVATGTIVHFDTGYVSPGAAVYCPFLTFERALGVKEERLEAAANQCAIGGSWCLRALQLLYNKAYEGAKAPELLISFSCVIDNTFAILNYHWIDHGETYNMAPLCKFDLTNDDHFSKFLLWIEAIGSWGIDSLLPNIKAALVSLQQADRTPPVTPMGPVSLPLSTRPTKEKVLIKALKTTFDTIPWQVDNEEFTPVSSSTASWGSPTVGEMLMSSLDLAQAQSISKKNGTSTTSVSSHGPVLSARTSNSPPPAYAANPDLVNLKRLNHAMDEIKDLQNQVESLKRGMSGSILHLQNELSNVKRTLSSVLKKENVRIRSRSLAVESFQIPQRTRPSEMERSCLHVEVGKAMPSAASTPEADPLPAAEAHIPSKKSPKANIIEWTALLISGQLLGSVASGTVLRILFFGCLSDICIRTIAGAGLYDLAPVTSFLTTWKIR